VPAAEASLSTRDWLDMFQTVGVCHSIRAAFDNRGSGQASYGMPSGATAAEAGCTASDRDLRMVAVLLGMRILNPFAGDANADRWRASHARLTKAVH